MTALLPSPSVRPTHPVELICCAIARQEGWFDGPNPPTKLHNPGDLRYAGQVNAKPSDPQTQDSLAEFSSDQAGIAGLFRQVWAQVAAGQSLRELISQWAPPNENNTSVYLVNVLEWTQLPADTPVLELIPQLYKV